MKSTHIALAAALLATALVGCAAQAAAPTAPNAPPAAAPDGRPELGAHTGTGRPGEAAVAVLVNDQPITMGQLTELLIANHGLDAAEQLIATAVVQQAAQREGISIAPADVEAEHLAALSQYAPGLDRDQQERALDIELANRNISRRQWDMIMRRNALLAKLAASRVQVTEELVQREFNRQYGAKVQIRHIQCASLTEAKQVLDLLDKGEDFADLARRLSTNSESAPNGGLIKPFSRDTAEVPLAIRNAAFALREGQVSEIVLEGTRYHILKLEKNLPPENVTYDEVKDSLRLRLHEAMLRQLQMRLLNDLLQGSKYEFVNPQLKQMAEEKARKKNELIP